MTFPFLACCRRFYAYKVQIHPATIARYFEFNAVFFETFSLPVPSYPINKAFPWPVFLDFVPNSVIPNEGVAVVKILVFNFPLICLNSCSDKCPQKTLSLKWSIFQITRFPHYSVSTDAMLGFYRKFKDVSFKGWNVYRNVWYRMAIISCSKKTFEQFLN